MRRELTRGKFRRKTSSGMLPLMAGCLMLSLAILWPLALWSLQDKKDPPAEVVETAYEEGRLPGGAKRDAFLETTSPLRRSATSLRRK